MTATTDNAAAYGRWLAAVDDLTRVTTATGARDRLDQLLTRYTLSPATIRDAVTRDLPHWARRTTTPAAWTRRIDAAAQAVNWYAFPKRITIAEASTADGRTITIGADLVEGADAIRGRGTPDQEQQVAVFATDDTGRTVYDERLWLPVKPGTDDEQDTDVFDQAYRDLAKALDDALEAAGLPLTDADGGYRVTTTCRIELNSTAHFDREAAAATISEESTR